MKKKALVLIIFAVLLLRTALTATGQTKGLREVDGDDWTNYKESGLATAYIAGFYLANDVILNEISSNVFLFSGIYKNLIRDTVERLDLPGITVGQMRDGLNKFYEDFSNRKIKIVDAIYIVKMQIKGENPDLINAQIRYLKMQPIINPPFMIEILNIIKKSAEDPKFNIKKEYLDTGKFTKDDFLKSGLYIDEAGRFYRLFCYGLYK